MDCIKMKCIHTVLFAEGLACTDASSIAVVHCSGSMAVIYLCGYMPFKSLAFVFVHSHQVVEGTEPYLL